MVGGNVRTTNKTREGNKERPTWTSLVVVRIVAAVVTVEINSPAPKAPPTATKMSLPEATAVDTMSEAPFPNASSVTP